MNDSDYMKLALSLAEKGRGYTSPNPMVGAVVVNNDIVVGKGWHRGAGLAHAEVEAINDAGEKAKGGDIYVTLEPCNHYGKTPPCTEKIIDAGIRRVFVGAQDPNPFVAGGGINFLRKNGIEVKKDVCRKEAEHLIEDFIWYVKNDKKPFVILKCASTLDGRLATSTGDSKWITNDKSRAFVHKLRHGVDGIMVGNGTLKNDNPSLTARIENFDTRDPKRIILDTSLSIDLNSLVLNQKSDAVTIIAASENARPEKRKQLEEMGAIVIAVPVIAVPLIVKKDKNYTDSKKKDTPDNKIYNSSAMLDLEFLLDKLGSMGIMSLLIEGGATLIHSALMGKLVNKVFFFMAPKILGGDDGVPICRGKGHKIMKDAFQLHNLDFMRFDDDILIQGYLK